MPDGTRGAYGIALAGPAGTHPSLPLAEDGWPTWSICWVPDVDVLSPGERFRLPGGGEVVVDTASRSAVLSGVEEPSVSGFLHPWLSFVATIVAQRRGFTSFHAGAFVHRERVWAVLGEKHAGKTSTLAWLSQHGSTVTSDDLVVLDGERSLSGPGCLDLRRPTAEYLGVGERELPLPGRERWRLWLPPPPAERPFAGFILPVWGGAADAEPVLPLHRLEAVVRHRAYLATEGGEARLLALAGRPMLRWSRPKDFTAMPGATAVLLAAMDALAAVT